MRTQGLQWSGKADIGKVMCRRRQRARQCRRVAFVGRVDRCPHDKAGVEVDHVLGLVSQMRRPILHPLDLRFGIDRTSPVLVGQFLAFAGAIEPGEIVDGFCSFS